jgi:AraC-like DNA-binding protein
MDLRLASGHYYGRVVQRLRVGELELTETRYAPGIELPRHCHQHGYFCLVRSGGYTETYGARRRTCGPLTVAFHPPGEVHSQRFGEHEVSSFNVEVRPGWARRLHEAAGVLDRPAEFQGGPPADLALRLFREFRQPDPFSALVVEGLVLELVGTAARIGQAAPPGASPPHWLARVREALHARFTEPLTLAALAELAGVHPVHLAATFRRHTGCTVGQYLRRLRVDEARRLLLDSDAPLAEVALAAGFADQSHLTRLFKRQVGLTPAAFRAAAGG